MKTIYHLSTSNETCKNCKTSYRVFNWNIMFHHGYGYYDVVCLSCFDYASVDAAIGGDILAIMIQAYNLFQRSPYKNEGLPLIVEEE